MIRTFQCRFTNTAVSSDTLVSIHRTAHKLITAEHKCNTILQCYCLFYSNMRPVDPCEGRKTLSLKERCPQGCTNITDARYIEALC